MATALKFWDSVSHPVFSTWTLLLQSHAIVRHAVYHRFAEMWNLFHKKDVWMKAYDALKPVKKCIYFFGPNNLLHFDIRTNGVHETSVINENMNFTTYHTTLQLLIEANR